MEVKLFVIICIISVILPTALTQCNIERAQSYFKRSIYEFNTNLVSRIAQESENHFVASPLSVYSLITSISEGAAGNTLAEIRSVLRLPHRCFVNKNYAIIKDLVTDTAGAIVERSGAIFIDENLSVKQGFINKVNSYNVTKVYATSFENFNEAANQINGYVSEATHGVIDEIVAPEDLENKYLLLTDVIYFKGFWNKQFDPRHTRSVPFKNEEGNAIGDVNMMFLRDDFYLTELKILKAYVLELPYKGGKFSMLVFLPQDNTRIADVIENLKLISIGSIYSVLSNSVPSKIEVQIPRFKITANLDNLKELVTDMGLHDMFDPARANFPEISDYNLYVSDLTQKADIEVTEEGTVAAAVTTMTLESRMLMYYPRFTADRPFLFMIVHKQTEFVLFTGVYSKPSQF